jgi:hypothetical protein
MVSIDFVAGSHGQYLEYVCNRFIAREKINYLPFNELGASHVNHRNSDFKFMANHFSNLGLEKQKRIVQIMFDADDLLLLSSVSYLRAGDANIDVRELDINTYHKLKNSSFSDSIAQINLSYGYQLAPDNPHCPRYILREYFKFGFKNPEINGFIQELKKINHPDHSDVFTFKFRNFYNTDNFIQNLSGLADWYGAELLLDQLVQLHSMFLSKQIFKDDKIQCDKIIKNLDNGTDMAIPKLSILQESYLNGNLENIYNIEMPFKQDQYFNSTQEVVKYLNVQNKKLNG